MALQDVQNPQLNLEEENVHALRRQRVFRDRNNPLDLYDDRDFFLRYRMTRGVALEVMNLVEVQIAPTTSRPHAIPANLQVLTALRYYATGSFQRATGDIIGISQPSVCRIVYRVSNALAAHAAEVISFPLLDNADRLKSCNPFMKRQASQVFLAVWMALLCRLKLHQRLKMCLYAEKVTML